MTAANYITLQGLEVALDKALKPVRDDLEGVTTLQRTVAYSVTREFLFEIRSTANPVEEAFTGKPGNM